MVGNDSVEPVESGAELPLPAQLAEGVQISGRPLSAVQVSEIVKDVIRQLAPDELPVFDSLADDWLAAGPRRWRSGKPPGAAVGFGVETLLLTQLAFPVIAAAIGEVLGDVAEDRLRGRPAGRHAAPRKSRAVGARAGDETPPRHVLSRADIRSLHEACERHARGLGMPAVRARLLADAVIGALSSRPGDD